MRDNIVWMLQYIFRMKGLYFLLITLAVTATAASLAMTGIQKWLIDDVFMNRNFGLILPLLAVFAGIVIVQLAANYAQHNYRLRAGFIVRESILDDMMSYLYSIPVKKYHSERSGKFMSYITNDVTNASFTVSGFIPDGIVSIAKVIILVVAVGQASPLILGMTTLLCIAYIWFGQYFGGRFKRLSKDVFEARSEVTVQIEEGISSTREVVAFHRMKWEKDKYNKSFSKYFSLVMADGKLQNKEMALLEPFRWAVTIIALVYGGFLVIRDQMTPGTFVVMFQFSRELLGSYEGLYKFYTRFEKKMANIERIREKVQANQLKRRDEGHSLKEVQSIELDKVWFRYSDDADYVLRNVSLSIPAGQKTAFVGASGGGKSTIAQLLIRFFDPQEGSIQVNGIPIDSIMESEWRSSIRIVFQEPYLYPDTIRNNLDMGNRYDEEQLLQALQHAELLDMIEGLPEKLDTVIGERGITLSGGQRQRLAIARALLYNPEVLILDEATSALDLETERRVQHNIDRLREGKTTIIIAHRLSTVENADWIYVMKDGEIAECGTHEQLIIHGRVYKELVYAQLKLDKEA